MMVGRIMGTIVAIPHHPPSYRFMILPHMILPPSADCYGGRGLPIAHQLDVGR